MTSAKITVSVWYLCGSVQSPFRIWPGAVKLEVSEILGNPSWSPAVCQGTNLIHTCKLGDMPKSHSSNQGNTDVLTQSVPYAHGTPKSSFREDMQGHATLPSSKLISSL